MAEIIDLRVEPIKGPQFFLTDKGCNWFEDNADFWDDEGLLCRVCSSKKQFIAVSIPFSTEDYFPVKIILESEYPGTEDKESFDHIVEVSILSTTGCLTTVEEYPESSSEIKLSSAGEYRLRVCFHGLNDEGELYPDNWCEIHIWKAPFDERKVIKWWPGWKPAPPPKTEDERRTMYGVKAYLTALKEKELLEVAKRDYEPSPEMINALPKGYKESALLFKDKDGIFWEYKTDPPHRLPFLRELTTEEAQKLFGYEE